MVEGRGGAEPACDRGEWCSPSLPVRKARCDADLGDLGDLSASSSSLTSNNCLFLMGRQSLGRSAGLLGRAGTRTSWGERVLAFRSRGGGMGLTLLARLVSPFFCESGEPEEEDLVWGLAELGRGLEESPSSFLTLRSSGWSCTGLRGGSCYRGDTALRHWVRRTHRDRGKLSGEDEHIWVKRTMMDIMQHSVIFFLLQL